MRLIGSLLISVTLTACDALGVPGIVPVECTLIGCDSQVTFELSRGIGRGATYDVEACVDGRCTSARIEVSPDGFGSSGELTIDGDRVVLVLPEGEYAGVHAVSLSLRAEGHDPIEVEAVTEFERLQPNGPRCEPTCWQAMITA